MLLRFQTSRYMRRTKLYGVSINLNREEVKQIYDVLVTSIKVRSDACKLANARHAHSVAVQTAYTLNTRTLG